MVNVEQIKKHNKEEFLTDIKRVSDVLVYAGATSAFLKTTKGCVLRCAEEQEITYYITDELFLRKREVMVII